ncbi:PH domain-containing protein [Halorubrum sp. SY-15]|uniref:PH domain-containing protein n=1 Tax=Halorubrum sp. SY-15 TaxID=3402277 RepID=UPI003EB8A58E
MKLAPQSIPYRALQKVSGVVLVIVFVVNDSARFGVLPAIGLAAAVLAAAVAYEVAYYRRFEYELTADTLDIRSGVISRREREIPYRRIQNVDVSRSVLQRAIGVAAVDLETAGGSETEGAIRFVTPEAATSLQREVQRLKRDTASADGTETAASPAPDEELLFELSPRELALVGALSFDGRLIGLLVFVGSGSVPVISGLLPDASAVALSGVVVAGVGGLVVVSWVLGAAVSFSNYYGFRLSRAGDELRYERGLFRRYSGSIPVEKVQTLTVTDNPAKRALGYATLTIETAGYAPGQGGENGNQAAIPIARRDRVYDLAREVESFGDPTFARPPRRVRWRYGIRYLIVVSVLTSVAFGVDRLSSVDAPWYAAALLLLAVPPAAHLQWRHRGYWLGEDHLLTRNGFWSRSVKAVPYYRIQNVIDRRSLFQRRWNVASVVADTAGTSSLVGDDAAAVDVDTDDAVALRDALTTRLQASLHDRRSRETGFEWVDAETVSAETSASVDAESDANEPEEDGSGDAARERE